jgi:hypothetical protein
LFCRDEDHKTKPEQVKIDANLFSKLFSSTTEYHAENGTN